jgi:hypothetical protein
MSDPKIPMMRLYERRSKSTGLTYFSARLGDLRLVIFRDRDEVVTEAELYGAEARWTAFVSPTDQGYRERVEGRQKPALAAVATPSKWRDK